MTPDGYVPRPVPSSPDFAYVKPVVVPPFKMGGFEQPSRRDTYSASVQPPETKPPQTDKYTPWGGYVTSDDPPVTFRHSGWARSRALIRQAMDTGWTSPRALQRFDLCGSEPWVAVNPDDPEHLTVLTNHCHSRWCVPCSRERAHRIVGNLRAKLNEGGMLFVTLTMKHSHSPLSDQIDRIYACFRRLRRTPFWLRNCDGGAAVLELTHGWKDGLWHVHLHCLLHSNWLEHKDLKAEWWRITGDSFVVDVRDVHTADQGAQYVTKYITKPIPNTVIGKPGPLLELLTACSRRRLVLTWGSWRGIKLSKPLDKIAWRSICRLEDLYARYEDYDLEAFNLVRRLERLMPEARALAGRGPPVPPFDAFV